MRKLLIAVMTVTLSWIFFGCHSSSSKMKNVCNTQSLRINIHDEPQTLDPRKARDLNCQTIARMLFEGLVRITPQEKPELALADSVEISEDLKTYIFHLKDSAWTNGDPVTANDFAYAWQKILSPEFPSDVAFHLYVLKNGKAAKEGKVALEQIGVQALDKKTLKVELENPTPYFLDLLAFPTFFPVHQATDEKNPGWMQSSSTYVSNGPFVLKEWKHQDHLMVVKNKHYWDASQVKIDRIEMLMLQEETELKMFEKNQIAWAGSPISSLPVDAIKNLQKTNLLHSKEMLGTYFIRANIERPPFHNPMMRKAFAMAINRQLIVDHVTQGGQIPATGLVPLSLGLQKQPYFKDGDLAEAKRLFNQALQAESMKLEQIPEITLTYRSSERSHIIAQAIQQQWFDAFGLRVKLEAIEGKVYYDRLSKQDYMLSSGSWIADFADAINFLEIFKFKNSGSNNTQWENPTYTELLDRSYQVRNFEERKSLMAQSEKILIDEMPIIPIFYYTMLYVSQPSIKGVVLSSMGQIDFKWASADGGKVIAQSEEK